MSEEVTDHFISLEEDYVECKRAVNNCINDLSTNAGSRQDVSERTRSNLVEAQRYLKSMMIESRGKSIPMRKAMQTKMNVYREEVKAMERDFDRAMLISKQATTQESQNKDAASSYYDQAYQNTERLQKSSMQLEASRRLVSETEAIGVHVLDNLAEQRESLLHARDKVKETNELTNDARKILKRMTRRMLTNRLVLWLIIAVLGVSICMVFYHNFLAPRPPRRRDD